MRGRKPKPTAIKELFGNPGKRALGNGEPKPRHAISRPPVHLDDEARKLWRRLSKQLLRLGVLTEIDREALATVCQTWSNYVAAQQKLTKYGPVMAQTVKRKDGTEQQYPMLSPYVVVVNQLARQLRAWFTEFGMTPSSRTRIKVDKADPEVAELDAFLES